MEKVIVIVGPTAVGKTALSVLVAKQFNGEIINGDSVQIYKELNIGSAKITEDEMQGITHHLLDFKEPNDDFSVAEFQELVRNKITEITNKGKLPVIAGGTGLYIQSVLYDYKFENEGRNDDFNKKFENLDNFQLHQLLNELDEESAKTIHPNNRRRVLRALEIYENAKESKTELLEKQSKDLLYDALIIGLDMDREILYNRINLRVDKMIKEGLIEEVTNLYNKGVKLSAIGYREFYDYFENGKSIEEVAEDIKKNTRHYAKRQLTYFRNKLDVNWFNVDLNNLDKLKKEVFDIVNLWLNKKI